MSDFIDRKRQEASMLHTDVTPVCNIPKVYSTANPKDPVTGIASISLKRNRYQDDLWTAGAEAMSISKQQFIRVACDKLCDELGIR